jgi:hypothetical protein
VYDLRSLSLSESADDFREYWREVERHCGRLGVPLAEFERGTGGAGQRMCQYRRTEEPDVHFELEARPDMGLIRVALDIECPVLFQALLPILEHGRQRLTGILGTGARFRDRAGPSIVSEWLPFDPTDPESARATALRLSCFVGALNPLLDRLLRDLTVE